MNKLIKPVSFLVIAFFQLMMLAAYSQGGIGGIQTMFTNYHQSTIREKLYVHTDKNFYVAGEIMWFKLYNVNASDHTPLDLSKVGYVEIIDSSGTHLLQAKIALHDAEGNGSFYLPLTLNSGNYKLRAYTNWMKNFGAEYFFEKDITLVNVQKKLSLPSIKPVGKYDVQFFPEGGNMVNNLTSNVAFKATDQYGKGLNFKGFLIDNTDTILTFEPIQAGMGSFSFTPVSQHIYKAYIKTDSGQIIMKDLPATYNSGYVMHVSDSSNIIKVTVQSDVLSQQAIYLFAHTREIIKVAQSSMLQNGKAAFIFDKALLGDGISSITIFNEQRQPVCERLYFKKPKKPSTIQLHADGQVYTTRKKVSLTIQSANTTTNYDTASLSLSVFRLDSLQSSSASNVDSYMLLTSDIKGYVEDPGYYFLQDNAETDIALDYVMLTNGWRRFKWEDVLKNSKPYFQYPPEYNGAIIKGTVMNTKTATPAAGIETYISVPGFQKEFNSSVSDTYGNIVFELKNVYGASEIIFQTANQSDSNYKTEIKDPFSNESIATPFPYFTLSPAALPELREQSISMQVQNLYTSKYLKHFAEPVIDTTPFYAQPDAKYLLDDYQRFTTIEEILREYVVLVDVRKREGNFHYSVMDLSNNQKLKGDPLVLIDGVAVMNINKFMQEDPLKLYKLDVINHKYFLGNSVFNGILGWTSYKKDMADYDLGDHATIIDYNGLQKEREFYSPVYENKEAISNHLPDFRNVLLWFPYIKIQSGNSKELSFYTSDLPGKYAIQVQGITKKGECVYSTTTFEVKK